MTAKPYWNDSPPRPRDITLMIAGEQLKDADLARIYSESVGLLAEVLERRGDPEAFLIRELSVALLDHSRALMAWSQAEAERLAGALPDTIEGLE